MKAKIAQMLNELLVTVSFVVFLQYALQTHTQQQQMRMRFDGGGDVNCFVSLNARWDENSTAASLAPLLPFG